MHIVMFYHSLLSDWNHGNAHFLRGIANELLARGHKVTIFEPENSWSLQNLVAEHGEQAIKDFYTAYPLLESARYKTDGINLNEVLSNADLVIVHEWNDHELVKMIGEHRKKLGKYKLLFHDTHHRAVTEPEEIAGYDLRHYDGVLAFGNVIRDIYLKNNWARRAWTWHEAADTSVFYPHRRWEVKEKDYATEKMPDPFALDLVWIGNWGDDERTAELHEFLLEPVKKLKLKARIYGVRYPKEALTALEDAGIEYGGWLANYKVPEVFALAKVTIHVPRRPYVENLPGIPTIRPFEALACAIPLVCSPWNDAENLFSPGKDYLVAQNGAEMRRHLEKIIKDKNFAYDLAHHGLNTIRERHTCGHRVDELLEILDELEFFDKQKTATV